MSAADSGARRPPLPGTLVVGAIAVGLVILLAVLGSSIAPYDPTAFSVRERLQPPSGLHWFGTDEFGRDILSRVLAGAGYSLAM
ncbi:MAG: ABC transporter permease, partial [Alphaproteobacteria bacterium]